MLDKEADLVNEEFIKRNDTYNIILGGGFNTNGFVTAKDKDNNYHFISTNDERYLSGELRHILKDMLAVRDKKGNISHVDKNDERYLSGELIHITIDKIAIKDKNGNFFQVDKNDNRFLSGEFVGVCKNMLVVRDKKGNILHVDKNDERYLSGELSVIWKDKKHTKETLKRMRETHNKNGHMQGEKNSQFGTCWIYNENLKENKKIKKNELNIYSKKGWKKGRKMTFK